MTAPAPVRLVPSTKVLVKALVRRLNDFVNEFRPEVLGELPPVLANCLPPELSAVSTLVSDAATFSDKADYWDQVLLSLSYPTTYEAPAGYSAGLWKTQTDSLAPFRLGAKQAEVLARKKSKQYFGRKEHFMHEAEMQEDVAELAKEALSRLGPIWAELWACGKSGGWGPHEDLAEYWAKTIEGVEFWGDETVPWDSAPQLARDLGEDWENGKAKTLLRCLAKAWEFHKAEAKKATKEAARIKSDYRAVRKVRACAKAEAQTWASAVKVLKDLEQELVLNDLALAWRVLAKGKARAALTALAEFFASET